MRLRIEIWWILLLTATGTTCTHYDFLTWEIYEQASFSNKVDVLFIVDNSESMEQEQNALTDNFYEFIQNLNSGAQQERRFPHDTLLNAVDNYLFYLNNQSRYINFQLGVTTTDVSDDGEQGTLVDPYPEQDPSPLFITAEEEDTATAFNNAILEVQWNQSVVGDEQGLSAMRQAICRALPDPAAYNEDTRLDLAVGCGDLTENEFGSNGAFLRPDVAMAVIVVTDEGDFSDATVEDYLEFLDELGKRYTISAIAPTLPEDENDPLPSCNPEGSPASSLYRYRDAAELSGGLLLPICQDFAEALDDLGRLINNLLIRFRLKYVPQPDSILVFVDGVEVPRSDLDGWIFDPALNSIRFTENAVPDYSATIEFYYRTVTATDPRNLPF